MLRLYHGKIPNVVSPRFTTLNWGERSDEVCSVDVYQLSSLGWIGLKSYVHDCSKFAEMFSWAFICNYYFIIIADENCVILKADRRDISLQANSHANKLK